MSEFHMPRCDAGIRWNDPAFNIAWPVQPAVISERDSYFADFQSRT
jgi:dTDP-4-dehydrorhamnose 3,5-epimerase